MSEQEPAEGKKDTGDNAEGEHRERIRQFIELSAVIVTAIFAVVGPWSTHISIWSVGLPVVAIAIALAIWHFDLTGSGWFQKTSLWVLVFGMAGVGIYIGHSEQARSATASKSLKSGAIGASALIPASAASVPTIHIRNLTGGDSIPMTPVVTGTVLNLAPSEVVWSFNEPYTTGSSPVPSGRLYPDAGPCRVDGSSFRCDLVFAGEKQDFCRQVQLWVAVITADEANDDINIKLGVTGSTYISLLENQSPPHVADAIDNIHVQRNPKPGGSC